MNCVWLHGLLIVEFCLRGFVFGQVGRQQPYIVLEFVHHNHRGVGTPISLCISTA